MKTAGARVFSEAHSKRTSSNGCKWHQMKCSLEAVEGGGRISSQSGLLLEQVSQRHCGPSIFEDIESMTRQDHEKPYLILKVVPI